MLSRVEVKWWRSLCPLGKIHYVEKVSRHRTLGQGPPGASWGGIWDSSCPSVFSLNILVSLDKCRELRVEALSDMGVVTWLKLNAPRRGLLMSPEIQTEKVTGMENSPVPVERAPVEAGK